MRLAITEESVTAINETAKQFDQIMEEVKNEIEILKGKCEENAEVLGPHSESIKELINDLSGDTEEGSHLTHKLTRKLTRLADDYANLIETNSYVKTR